MPTVSFTTSGALSKSALRQANERLVLNAIRRAPGISRAEIARVTGLARTSVTFVVNRLLQGRLVIETKVESQPPSAPSAGRPPTALQLAARTRLAIGVEVTRRRSRVVLVDLIGGVIAQREISWHPTASTYLNSLQQAIHDVASGHRSRDILGVGVSLPGTIDKASGRVIGAEGLGWIDVAAGDILRRHIPWPLFFENDANLAALAEQWFSPAGSEPLRYFVYVQTQGGLGTGVVVDGRLLHGVASAAAEFGHVMLDPNGRPCSCGNRGCWEQYASDAALVRNFADLGGRAIEPAKSLAIVQFARAGDKIALQALRETALSLALGFVNLIAVLNPQAIILGEPFSSAWDLVQDVIHGELLRRVPAYNLNGLRLLPSREGANAALRGAAALVLARFFTSFDHTKHEAPSNGVFIQATS